MEEIAEVYARSLFEVAQERNQLDLIREQLGQFADALNDNRDVSIFFFSPYFSTEEKKAALKRVVVGADPTFENFLEALIERHRMPVIYRIRTRYDEMWDKINKLLPVELTSAVALDEGLARSLADRIGEQTGDKVELTTTVDPDIIGGLVLRVGNFILDASIRNSLNQLRKQVAQG
jgi:F-type H+-transporting ATPase subunit delta